MSTDHKCTTAETVPPPVWRFLIPPVALTVTTVAVVFITSVLHYDDLMAYARAADPMAPDSALVAQFWGRLVFGVLLALSWPACLQRIGRGSTAAYRRCRPVAAVAMIVLIVAAVFSPGPGWMHLAHAVLALCEFAILATTMHPAMRSWYATTNTRTPSPGPRASTPRPLDGGDDLINPPSRGTGFVVAAVAGLLHAGSSVYWGLGGDALLETVGAIADQFSGQRWMLVMIGLIKGVVALLPLALFARRRPIPGLLRGGMWAGGAVLVFWGAANTATSALLAAGVIPRSESYDRTATLGHALLWDPLFLAWGLALATGLWVSRPLHRKPGR